MEPHTELTDLLGKIFANAAPAIAEASIAVSMSLEMAYALIPIAGNNTADCAETVLR
jgi:hypothetical protein